MTRVRKRVVMAMMMWVRGVTVRSPVMQRRQSPVAAAVPKTVAKAALTTRGSSVAEAVALAVSVAVTTAIWSSMAATSVAVAVPVAVSMVAA